MQIVPLALLIFAVAVSMTMVGKGGGNFYVLILALMQIPMHTAAATGQFILFWASAAALLIFHKNRNVSWKLALIIGTLTAVSALAGGFLSHAFSSLTLKAVFAAMLFAAGAVMLIPVRERTKESPRGAGLLTVTFQDREYRIHLGIVIPVTLLTGFFSGMVGVSGGSFLVPLMVLAGGVPMAAAVGTSSVLIGISALTGFAGHALSGDFDPSLAVPLAAVTVAGGLIGGRLALKSKPKNLKRIFAYTNWLAAVMMGVNILRMAVTTL